MTTLSPVTFFTSCCPSCARQVLGERALVEDILVWRCLSCATPLDVKDPSSRWLADHELELVGCFIEGLQEPPKHGEEGGCRGGTCGVQQPVSKTT